jgi:carbonic anhydrase/acetyltransferase-like protein (isoleucine patch superfamily)
VAANATVIGRVTIAAGASIWYGAVVRGDVEAIVIGECTNIQDGAILHGDPW